MDVVKFTQMKDGDRADYSLLDRLERPYADAVGGRLLDAMRALDGGLTGYQVTRLEHSLQSATRAWRDGADLDWVVAALLHDIGDVYAPYNHDEYAATILRPYVRAQVSWVVQVHADFQKYYYAHHLGGNRDARDRHADHPCFQDCVDFCERWDQASFDPEYDSLPLDFFRPMVLEVFGRTPYDPAVIREGQRVALADGTVATRRQDGTDPDSLRDQ